MDESKHNDELEAMGQGDPNQDAPLTPDEIRNTVLEEARDGQA